MQLWSIADGSTDVSAALPQEQHIAKELLQCDMHVSNSQAQNLQTLWQVLEQHQPSVPPQQQPSVEHSRCAAALASSECYKHDVTTLQFRLSGCRIAVKPAASDRAQTSDIQAEGRTVYAKIANPLEVSLQVWPCTHLVRRELDILLCSADCKHACGSQGR